jgi:hypothetical protein
MSPPLYEIVDFLSKESSKVTPQFLEDRPILKNFTYGFVGSNGVMHLMQYGVSKAFPKFYDTQFPKIEKWLGRGIIAVPILYAAIDPQAFQQMVQDHPVYSGGMVGAIWGGVKALFSDAKKPRGQPKKNLDRIIHSSEE